MKIKQGFVLKKISGQNVIVSDGEKSGEFNNTITLNETYSFLWNLLENETTKEAMLNALLEKYDISTVLALNEIDVFVRTMKEYGIIE